MLLIMYVDQDQIPRAWAYGPKDQRPSIEGLAVSQLLDYVSQRWLMGDTSLSHDDFTKIETEY